MPGEQSHTKHRQDQRTDRGLQEVEERPCASVERVCEKHIEEELKWGPAARAVGLDILKRFIVSNDLIVFFSLTVTFPFNS